MLESLNQYQFIFAAINIIILYIVLRKILFKPVSSFMENRTRSIQDDIEKAERLKAEAAELRQRYDEQMKASIADGKRIKSEAAADAGRTAEKIIAEAKQNAHSMLADARAEIENERMKMLKEVRSEVASLALEAASKVLEADVDNENSRALVDKFLDEAGVA
ncbi:MAG: F0F1 ATP synthase subunit B [Oscillospiraceae bacterium]